MSDLSLEETAIDLLDQWLAGEKVALAFQSDAPGEAMRVKMAVWRKLREERVASRAAVLDLEKEYFDAGKPHDEEYLETLGYCEDPYEGLQVKLRNADGSKVPRNGKGANVVLLDFGVKVRLRLLTGDALAVVLGTQGGSDGPGS